MNQAENKNIILWFSSSCQKFLNLFLWNYTILGIILTNVLFVFLIKVNIYEYEIAKGVKVELKPWLQLITLQPPGSNHFWTVPIQLRYYFFIPPICLTFYLSGRKYFSVLLTSCIMFYLYMLKWVTKINKSDLENQPFWSRFPVFFLGSIAAISFFRFITILDSIPVASVNSKLRSLVLVSLEIYNSSFFKFLIGMLTLFLYFYGNVLFPTPVNIRSQHIVELNICCIWLMLVLPVYVSGSPNFLTNLIGDNYLFKMACKCFFSNVIWEAYHFLMSVSYSN